MSKGQNIISSAKKVHFQEANVELSTSDESPIIQVELEKLGQIPFGTIHLGRDQKIEQDVEPSQSFELQGVGQQSQSSGDASSCKVSTANSNLPSFEAGHQNQLSSHVKKPVGPQKTSNILAALSLSSKDLDEVESYPKDKLTLDSLPKILKQIKKKRASLKHSKGDSSPQQCPSNRTSRDDGIEEKSSKKSNSESQDTVRKPLVNYDYDPSSGESSPGSEQEGISGDGFHKKERHFSESPHHLSKFDSDSDSESDYEEVDELPFPCAEELSLLERKRRTPIVQNIKDFLGYLPVVLPHCCSLCDKIIDTLQDWNEHMNDPLHKLRCLLLQRVYPDWVPGELPVAKKNPVVKCKVPTVIRKKKVKVKRSTESKIPTQGKRENLKEPHNRIVVLGNLPSSGFSDFDTVRLGSTFGKVLKYLKVGEKAFLKMDSEIASNNIIEHFKKKPLFYGRLLTADISSAQIQPLLKKPSAKIEEMLNKVNQADISTRECFLGPILKNKPDDLKKYPTSERERKSSESSEKAESKSSDESSEIAEWKSFESFERVQRRSRERQQRRNRERQQRRSREIIQRRSRERRERRISREREERRVSRERGERRVSRERGERRGSRERGERRGSDERGERRGSDERGERRGSSERGERRGSSERGERRGSSERGERRGSSERGERQGSSERGERRGSSERGERRRSESREKEWGSYESRECAEWENDESYISEDNKESEINNDVEMKSEELLEETVIPFLESDSELEDLMEKYESGDDEANLEDTQNEGKDEMEEADIRADAEMSLQEIVSEKKQKEDCPENRMVLLENLPPSGYSDAAIEKLGAKFGKVQKCVVMRHVSQAFLEMESEKAAMDMVRYYRRKTPLTVRGKKVKVRRYQSYLVSTLKNTEEEPGQVVYIGDMAPGRCTNDDLIHLAELFGKITNILLIKAKGEGFVEMSHSAAAQAMAKFYQTKPPVIQGNVVRVELCQKYKKLSVKFPEWEPTAGLAPPFAISQHRQLGVPQNTSAPEEDILAPTSTPNLAELRAKYSAQLLRWAKVPLEGNMPFKNKRWDPQTYEGKELDCFRFLPYAFKTPMLETHDQYLRSITGTPDMYELDTPKIDDAFIQLLVGKKVIRSREDLDKQLGEPERVLCKAQSKVAEIVGPLIVAIQKYELDELSGELDSLTTEQLKERLQSTVISCHQSIVCAGQTHRWLTSLRSENLLQLFKFNKMPVKPQEHPNMTSSDLLGAEIVEQIKKRAEVLKHVTTIPPVKKKPIINVNNKKRVFQRQQRWQLPYYRNPNPFRSHGKPFRGHPIFKSRYIP
ncbi:uncharacterized protein [Heptranchias perlo]|uniref:uncharacterized protein n=1 Tax=Heptranchias perlo TaxID=212740 RepID=UPI00355A6706